MLSEDVYQRIFAPRAVTREVAEERPYVRYPLNGRGVIYATDPKYRNEMTCRDRWLVQRVVAQHPGIVIAKEPFPGADQVFAQLRPDAPLIFPGNSKHRHDLNPSAFHEADSHRKHLRNKDHSVVSGPRDPHVHEREAKYFLPSGKGRAKRFDVHPSADVNSGGGVGFLALEGSIKADSILSAGYDRVLAVPSVTCWRAEELPNVAAWASELDVFAIVSDSDWYTNTMVVGQSRRARDYFRNSGVNAIHVSPPHPGKGPKLGVDDYLAGGGRVEDLLVVDARLPEAIEDLIPGKRTDARDRNRRTLEQLIRSATPNGLVQGSGRWLSDELGKTHDRASLAIRDLIASGLVKEIEKSTKRLEPWGQWTNTPTRWLLLDPKLHPILVTNTLGSLFPQVRA